MVIYLDNAATTPLSPEVIEILDEHNKMSFANPSSLHSHGRKSKKLLKASRETIAKKINARSEEIFFTSGATEANNIVFKGLDYNLIITTPFEHPSVLEPAKASRKEIIYLNLDSQGFINNDELDTVLANNANKKILVSIMHGNNEIGTVQDLESIGSICKKHNAFFHSDCVQTFGKLDIDVTKANLDFISTSAHKLHGPKGIGFLYKNKDIDLDPLVHGGGQESNLRSGTENLSSIIAFAKAVESYGELEVIEQMQEQLLAKLLEIPGLSLNGPDDFKKRVPGNINISQSKFDSEQLVLQMDLASICISSGSACSSNKGNAEIISSYVLRACRLPEHICKSAVRISISKLNSIEEIDKTISCLQKLLAA